MGVLLILIVPMYAGFAYAAGDPFLPSTFGATVNRNLEFPERHGTPGFPTEEAFARDWAAGPTIGPSTYLFGYHTVPQLVEYSARGMLVIFRDIFYRHQPWLLAGFLVGGGLMLLNGQWLVPLLLLVLLAPPYAFLAGAPNDLFPARYAHHALPWAELVLAYGVAELPRSLLRLLLGKRSSLRRRRPLAWSAALAGRSAGPAADYS
jgi:hypothetical protein